MKAAPDTEETYAMTVSSRMIFFLDSLLSDSARLVVLEPSASVSPESLIVRAQQQQALRVVLLLPGMRVQTYTLNSLPAPVQRS